MGNHYWILEQRGNFITHMPFVPSWKHCFCSLCFQNGPHFPPSRWAPQTFVRPPRTARHFAAAPAHHYQTPRPPWFRSLSPLCTNPQTAGLMETFPKRFSVQSRRLLGKSRLQAVLSPRRLHPTVLRDSASQKGYPQLIWHSNGLENLGCLLHSG